MKVGIDLGTTYSAIATFDEEKGEIRVLKNTEGQSCTPSVVCLENGEEYFGNEAKNMMSSGDDNAAAFYKSFMGDKNYSLFLGGKSYTPEDLSAIFLKKFVADVEQANSVKIDGAVITVPAYFDEHQRQATINAGKKAGLNILKIINEPTAAIIAYGLTGTDCGDKTLLVYDLGGGTFDVTIAKIHGSSVDVVVTNGNHMLGGKNWDNAIYNELNGRFADEFGVDINDFPEDRNVLTVRCEEAKKKLSAMNSVTVSVSCNGFSGRYEITRQDFDEQTEYLLNQTFLLIDSCFQEVSQARGISFGWRDIDGVVLVGGSTRMPQVKERIEREYGKPPITKNVNVDTIVASGAAIQAKLCVLKTLSLGGGTVAATTLSGAQQKKRPMMTLSGADIHDITSHSLGMLVLNKSESDYVNSIILPKNSRTGTVEKKPYSFSGKNLDIYVLQGESDNPLYCNILYRYCVADLDANDKNDIIVSFSYNNNGIVEVGATRGGRQLNVEKCDVNEDIDTLLKRLRREHEEQKNRVRNVEVTIFVDVSGSMEDDINTATDAVNEFISSCNSTNVTIGLYAFADRVKEICRSSNPQQLYKWAKTIAVDGALGYGTGACPLSEKGGRFCIKDSSKIIVVLTDGVWVNASKEIRAARALKSKEIFIYAVGIGDADRAFLEEIASPGGAQKINFNQLNQTFKNIAGSIAVDKNR